MKATWHYMTGSKPILLALKLQSHMQFYHFIQSEMTIINGKKERNEITKLCHVTEKWLPENLYSIYLEVFDRIHKSSELSTSEKEFITRMEYMTNEISVISNQFCEIKEIENTQQIEDKTTQQILKLSKEYVGRNAENTFIILKKKARTQSLLITDLCKYNNWGLIFNACYGKYNPNERKSRMRPFPYLIKQMSLNIREERWVNEANEEQIIVNIIGSLDETIAIDEIKSKLLDRGVILKETDQPNLKEYNGSFCFYRKTGQMIGAELRIDFECGNNYIKQVSYSLNAINYEDSLALTGGNPNIKSVKKHLLGMNISLYNKFSIAFDYQIKKDEIIYTRILTNENSNQTLNAPLNIKKSKYYNLSLNYADNINNWNYSAMLLFEKPDIKVPEIDQDIRIKKTCFSISFQNTYTISKHISIYGNLNYSSSYYSAITYNRPTNDLTFGLIGNFIGKRLNIRLTGTDILDGSNWNNWDEKYLNIKTRQRGDYDMTGVQLSVTYKFNKTNKKVSSIKTDNEILRRTE